MIVNFKEKFSGDDKLIKISERITAVLTLIVWASVLNHQVDKVCDKLIQPGNVFYEIVLGVPIHVGYLLFYWAGFSWIVYLIAKMRYKAPEIKG